MSVIDPLNGDALGRYTELAQTLSPYRDNTLDMTLLPTDSVVVSRPDKPSPIEHVIYIVKENRTYDQVFGKIGKGNSDPSLCLFDENSAPNHYKLAREFVLFDNFYVNAMSARTGIAGRRHPSHPTTRRSCGPTNTRSRRKHYDFEGGEPANSAPAGYLWNNALAAGRTVRNYGYWVTNSKEAAAAGRVQIESVQDPALRPITNMNYRSFDLDYPDVNRARTFFDDLKQFESSGIRCLT